MNSMMDKLSIKAPSKKTKVVQLSGGNQQKVCISKCILAEPEILLLDEPTRGVDVGTKLEIYNLIYSLADQGLAVIVVSSELPELLNICDRIYIVASGKIRGELSKEEADENSVMKLAVV